MIYLNCSLCSASSVLVKKEISNNFGNIDNPFLLESLESSLHVCFFSILTRIKYRKITFKAHKSKLKKTRKRIKK